MKDTPLLSVTKILDDESGICASDLCDFSIHCADLEDFLIAHGDNGAKAICDQLDYLKKSVMEDYLPKSKNNKKANNKIKIKVSKKEWQLIR